MSVLGFFFFFFKDFQLMFWEVFFHCFLSFVKRLGVVGGIWRIGFRDFVILMSICFFVFLFLRNCSVFRMREYM